MFLFGSCADTNSPLYFGEDPTLQFAAVIELDSNIGCFVLTVEGTGVAPTGCRPTFWAGYGSLVGNYVRICGSAGGCDANAGVSILTVST
jgi:hypothetical protein